MDGRRDVLHFGFNGEHVFFSGLRLSSGFQFFTAALLTVCLCAVEKYLSYLLASKWDPLSSRNSRLGNAAFRSGLYWILTLIRLLYMLLAMTFNLGLILVVVTALSVGQFIIEYIEKPHPRADRIENAPLLSERDTPIPNEYIEVTTLAATEHLHPSPGYPPRSKIGLRSHKPLHAVEHDTNEASIFVVENGEDTPQHF